MLKNRSIERCMYFKKDKCLFLGNCSNDNCKHYKKNQEINDAANKNYYYLDNDGKKRWKGLA